MRLTATLACCAFLFAVITGCGNDRGSPKSLPTASPTRAAIESIGALEVSDETGQKKRIMDYATADKLVVVFSRGFSGTVCPFCCSQTQSLASNYARIKAENTEVLVVFPIQDPMEKKYSSELVEAARIVLKDAKAELPFPLAYDVQAMAVDQLGIRAALAMPATFILDKQGKVRFSYVGRDPADRPRVEAIIKQLKSIQ